MTTIADVLGWTSNPVSLSRLEEQRGWLGRWPREQEPPAWQRDEPNLWDELRQDTQ